MKASRILLALTLITSVCSAQEPKAGAAVPVVEGSKPNIVIIFTDDQGYADLGCYGNQKNKTPRMDQLAKEGTRFTSFYAQSVCGPSRSALLTGRYPIRSKGWAMPASEITFAELIRDVGYQTACIGKWDVSNRKAIIDRMPNAQGFDYYFGALGANDNGSVAFYEDNNEAGRTDDMGSLTTLYTNKAIDFLENRRDPNKPFVLYLAHTMMHTVIDASERFRGKSRGGLYGDVVEEFDYETGRLLDTLDELGLRKDTLVIYTTDNGPWNQPAYYESKMGLRPDPDLKYRSKNKKRPAGFFQEKGTIFWGESGPLRNGKGSCYEGGSRVPCIVRWPGKVPAGKTSDAIFATIDFLPTFAALAGFEVPDDRIIDGVDQSELLLGHSRDGARQTFFYQGNGVRQGRWKYLQAVHSAPPYWLDHYRKEVEELYDLDSDIGETTNLAEKYPEKLEELRALMKSIAEGEGSCKFIPETPAMPKNPPKIWLTYHLAHPGPGDAKPGDPNPAFFWKGRYHLHYIYRNRTGFCFAHVSSEDMVHWKWHPTVLEPKTTGHGMFSGTGFITKDGRPAMVYHGQRSDRNWICYALDDNLDKWTKPHEMTPRDKDGKLMTDMPYFDPDIWIKDGIYYGVNGRSNREPAVLMKSENLKDWDYIGELLHPDFDEEKLGVGRDEDISCANMFKLGEKWVLLCISHKLGCRYFIGDFKGEQFLPEQHGLMNWAKVEFFAPESLLTPDGRRVMWAWCAPRGARKKLADKIQTGIQSLPRELSLSDEGTLLIKPLRELKKLRSEQKTVTDLTVKSDSTHMLEGVSGDTMELELVLEAPSAKEFGIKLLCDQDGSNGLSISSGKGSKTLNVGYIQPPFELQEGEDLTLRIFIDKNMIEVFANDRQAALAWHDYDADDLYVSLFSKGGDLKVKKVSAWQMKSIYPDSN